MKYLAVLGAVALAISLVACGGSNNSSSQPTNPGTGTWSATVAAASGSQLGSFTFNMMQNNTALSGSNMNFSNMGTLGSCFGAGTVMNGQMGPGMMNGGNVDMTMSWTPSGSTLTNTMVMKGTMATGMGSGNGAFTLTGQTSGCTSQNGTFSMTRTSSSIM